MFLSVGGEGGVSGAARCVKAADGGQRVPLRFPLALHPRDVVADFVVACVIAHCPSPFVTDQY
jgi:hypothetical protein